MIEEINAVMEEIRLMLIEKNRAYGNSAIKPVRIFSKADNVEQLKVRIDDKISRVMTGSELAGEATIDDLIGYLVLLKVARRIEGRTEQAQMQDPYAADADDGRIFPYQQTYAPQSYQGAYPQNPDPVADVQEDLNRYYGDRGAHR